MVRAEAAEVHYHYDDHDTDEVDEIPPVQNTWYEVFDAEDVRHLYCAFNQTHDEAAALDVQVRWTIDGNVYGVTQAAVNGTIYYVYRDIYPGAAGAGGLATNAAFHLAAFFAGKRGKSYKVEVRLTGVPGTNQRLRCWCVRETDDQT